jgi:hypothetical protein
MLVSHNGRGGRMPRKIAFTYMIITKVQIGNIKSKGHSTGNDAQ